MKYTKREIKKGITLHLINTKKFKTNLIAVFLSTNLTRENVTKNALISSVLRRGTNNLKTSEEISKKLEEMYGAEFNSGLDKIGKDHVLKFYIESINDEFITNSSENILKSSIQILSDIIFNPLNDGNKLSKEYVEQEKENVKQIIEAKKDNKAKYAAFRCMEEMYKNAPEGLYKYGYVEDLDSLNETNLYEYYSRLIGECKIDIFVSGDIENVNVEELVQNDDNIKKLNDRDAVYVINEAQKKEKIDKENIVEETLEVVQGKLVLGYDIILNDEMLQDENVKYIGMVYNMILGGSANSKLFQNVREKASLAYTINSSYAYNSGNIFVSSGIDIPNYEKALEISKTQVEDMKNGNFTEDDLDNAKKIIISNIFSIDDEQDTEIIYYLGQILSGQDVSLDEYVKRIENITKEQVLNFAQTVYINTIYFIKGK